MSGEDLGSHRPRAPRQKKKGCCPKGHDYTPENTYTQPNGQRHCRTCQKMRQNARPKSHCVNGHEMSPENTYVRPGDKRRFCKACIKDQTQRKCAKDRKVAAQRRAARERSK